MSLNGLIKIMILSLWLATFGWLIRYEAFPHLFDDTVNGYKDLARHLPALRDSWMNVMADGQHVGYVNASIEMTEHEGEEQLLLNTQMLIRMSLYNQLQLLRLNSEVKLDARQKLIGSVSSFSMGDYSGELTITPLENDQHFEMSVQFNEIKFIRQIEIPAGAVISSPLMDTGLRSVKAGRQVNIRTLDPFSMSGELRTIQIKGLSTTQKVLPGDERLIEVTRVEMKVGDLVLFAEVDEYGRIVKQETPFGVTFVLSEAREAMKIPQGNALNPMTLLNNNKLPSLINLPVDL